MSTENNDYGSKSLDRRTVVAGIAAPALASPALAQLIEHHRAAYTAFVKAIDRDQEVEAAYEAAHGGTITVPSLLGGGYDMSSGYEDCKKHIAAGYEKQRRQLEQLSRVAPALAEQVRAVMDAKEAENMAMIDRVFAEEEARQEAFGVAAAKREYDATCDAEYDALLAVCSYRCKSIDEAGAKASYLLIAPGISDDGLQPDHVAALLQSFVSRPDDSDGPRA